MLSVDARARKRQATLNPGARHNYEVSLRRSMRAAALLLLAGAPLTRATTLAAARCPSGVALGADSRATEGSIVADSKCDKLHALAENVFAAGYGGAADADDVARLVALELRTDFLRRTAAAASAGRNRCRVTTARGGIVHRLRSAPLGCAFLVGGCDATGPSLYRVEGDGSAAESTFATMGSGQMAAAAVLEAGLRCQPEPDEEGVVEAVRCAVEAGIRGDTGSGGHVDVVFVDANGTTRYRFPARPCQ